MYLVKVQYKYARNAALQCAGGCKSSMRNILTSAAKCVVRLEGMDCNWLVLISSYAHVEAV